jgi:uncharacterized membrane protein YccF (DUF307 family)
MGQDSGVTEGTGMGADDEDTQVVDVVPPARPGVSPPVPPGTRPPVPPGVDPPPAPRASPGQPDRAPTPARTPDLPAMRPGTGTVTELKTGPDLAVRAIWFVLVGWWLTGIVSAVAWVAMVTLIGLPLGIFLINRIPTVLTLRPRTSYRYQYTDELGRLVTIDESITQPPWYVRGLWFIFVGWWASGIAMTIGWILCILLITLPIGLWIYNRIPAVASLYRY